MAPHDDRPDAELATAAADGDRAALDELLQRHVDRIHAVCRRILGEQDAADATQDALIAVVRGIGRFDGRSQFSTWCYRVATNAALDEARRRARRPHLVDATTDDAVLHRARAEPGTDDAVADRVDVDAALRSLPVEFRAAVALRDLADLDYGQIAQILEIPPGTVRSRISRGRAALADALGNRGAPADRLTPRSP